MRLPVWLRALTAVWGLWFTAVLSEAPGLHTCAVHSSHSAHAMESGSAGHAMHMATDGDAAAPAGHSSADPSQCTCLGLCCCASPHIARTPSIEIGTNISFAAMDGPHDAVAPPLVQQPYSQPFANGPPAL